MLQRAASNACSWWWASHIRTKQSKWLDTDLQEMEERVNCMLKIVEQDGDSFARKAEMYFKKRPELIHFVDETFKAYKALADRYDHISSELHKANHTIATAFPDQIQFDMQDDDDDDGNLSIAITSIDPSKLRKPSTDIPPISLMSKKKENHALKKSRLARVPSRKSKDKAQEEIGKLQKGILVLQTEKEYVKSTYENGIAKYWDIEKKITEMQEEVFSLQDEFSASMVIDDDEARALMAVTALKSCENSLVKLEERQKQSMDEVKIETDRIQAAKEKIEAVRGEYVEIKEIEEVLGPQKEYLDSQSLCDMVKEQIEISTETSVVELAEKINELVNKVIEMELTASSQTAQIESLKLESDQLHRHLCSFQEEKKTLIDESNSLRDELQKAEEKLQREKDFDQHAQDKITVVGDISVEVMSPKHQDKANIISPSQEVTSLYNSDQKDAKDTPKLEEGDQDEKFNFKKRSTEACRSLGESSDGLAQVEVTPRNSGNKEAVQDLDAVKNLAEKSPNQTCHSLGDSSEILTPPKNREDVKISGLSQVEVTPRNSEYKEVIKDLDADKNLVEKNSTEACNSLGDVSEISMAHLRRENVKVAGISQMEVTQRYLENKDVSKGLAAENNSVEKQEVETSSPPADYNAHSNVESTSQTEKHFDHLEAISQPKNDSVKSQALIHEVNMGSSRAKDDHIHPSWESKPQLEQMFDTSEASSQLKGDSMTSHFPEWEVDFSSSLEDGDTHPSNQSKPQLLKPFDLLEGGSHLQGDSIKSQVPKYEFDISSLHADGNIHPSIECRPQFENHSDHFEAASQLNDPPTQSHDTKQGTGSSEKNDNLRQSKESMPQQFEDQEVSLDWLQTWVNGVEGKEKIILSEYTSILRSYKDMKKRLSEIEMKNQEYALETAMKDRQIHSLQQNLLSLQSNSNNNSDKNVSNAQKPEILAATARKHVSFDVADIKLPATDGWHATSAIEEKFRRDIDTVLEENLEFWLRFSTSFHGIQKFQATFEELQAEIKKLKHKKLGESSSQSEETSPVDKKLRELKTEIQVWLEQNMLLQGELESKFSALSSIQEEISGTLEASLEASLEADVIKFAPYQAAKFQGELLNMQLENNKVAEELKAGIDHTSALQAEVENSLSSLHKKLELPQPGKSNHEQSSHASTKHRVPLKSFLFVSKPKKKQSVFARVNPALQKHLTNRSS